jgi:hypothetical protein
MDRVFLYLKNRHGEWGPAWAGFVDTKTRVASGVQPGQVSWTPKRAPSTPTPVTR